MLRHLAVMVVLLSLCGVAESCEDYTRWVEYCKTHTPEECCASVAGTFGNCKDGKPVGDWDNINRQLEELSLALPDSKKSSSRLD